MERNISGPEISRSDCYKVMTEKLGPGKDFKIIDFQQSSFDSKNGYLGEHSRLKIEIEDASGIRECYTFFVKDLPDVQSQRDFLQEINGDLKEKSFFNKFCPLLKSLSINVLDDVVPACYLIKEGTFVFEDMESKGFTTLASREPLNVECIKLALICLAKLHASGLILEEFKSSRLTRDFGEELKESFYLGTKSTERALHSCKRGIEALIDITHTNDMKISKRAFIDKALEGLDLQKIVVIPTTRFRNTICHADPWTKNFMFKFEKGRGVDCVLVDFQTYRYGPPGQDVMAFLHLVTDRKTRDDNMEEFLRFYYRNLTNNIESYGFKDVVTWDEFLESCRYFKKFALSQMMTHFQIVIMSDEVAGELFSDQKKAKEVLFGDEKYDFVINTCQRDFIFKRMNFEGIEELRDLYENKLIGFLYQDAKFP